MSARSREFVAAQAWLERLGVPIALSVNPVARLFWSYRRYCATEASLRVIGLEPTTDDPSGMRSHSNDGGGRRLVAAGDAGRIWRYAVDADDVKLDRLDGKSWDKRKAAIDETLAQSATAMLALAEERAGLAAPVMDPDPAAFERFVGGFAFNETADQARAARAIRDDLARGKPMDHLVIGDVGFGKTEVAFRARRLPRWRASR